MEVSGEVDKVIAVLPTLNIELREKEIFSRGIQVSWSMFSFSRVISLLFTFDAR